uniref:Uncharacterized protein n=1 Tax=Thermogemmatispora argillosa TaxID=2045280 RepID=A0A455T3I3_9CHLR|nr:hypothetical protein KTA_25650 [Thermogemmatispora argillosa]
MSQARFSRQQHPLIWLFTLSLLTALLLLDPLMGTRLRADHFLMPKASSASRLQGKAPGSSGHTAVLTYKNDNWRSGQNTTETILTLSNVNAQSFGKRVAYPVDGQIYAQPLYVPNLNINGLPHNVVFVATEHDSIYAFDADAQASTSPPPPLWHVNYLSPGETTVAWEDVACGDTVPEIGITGTPVIDLSTRTMFFVTFSENSSGQFFDRLHAIDISTGRERPGSPVVVRASVPGQGAGSQNGTVSFDPRYERQRAALLLANGQIYIAWGSFCDNMPYHGWIMSYSYDGSGFHQTHVFNVTPDGAGAGVWHGGGGLAADGEGNIYFISGNGDFEPTAPRPSLGDSFIKLSPDLRLLDYFAPFNQECLGEADADLGSGGPLLLPSYQELIGGGKEGRIYVLDTNKLGQFTTISQPCTETNRSRTDVDQVLQETPPSTVGGMYGTPAYWRSANAEYVYVSSVGHPTLAYRLQHNSKGQALLSSAPSSQTPERSFLFSGGNPSLSSNGTSNGILWLIDPSGVLRAYDATNLSHELYSSSQDADYDTLDSYVKFSTPTIADGRVFVPTKTTLTIYGLLNKGSAPPPPVTYNNVGISDDFTQNVQAANYDGLGYSYSATALAQVGITPGASVLCNGLAFIWPDLPAGVKDNYQANGQTIPLNSGPGITLLAFLGSATQGSTSGIGRINYSDGSTQPFTLGLTDWTTSTPAFNNKLVATMSYRNGPGGQQPVAVYLFYADVAVDPTRVVKSVTLPPEPSGPSRLHVFAMATQGLYGSYNNIGVSDDHLPAHANFDNAGHSYSLQALQQAGINPGDNAFYRGVSGVVFQWPNAAAGQLNNYIACGQTLPVAPQKNASLLAFLGAASGGPSYGTAYVNYSDGSRQAFTLGFSDWTLNDGKASRPSFGNGIFVVLPYRNQPTGQEPVKTYIFYAEVALQSGKSVKSVTLPARVNQGLLHVFALSTKTAEDTPYNNAGTSDDSNPQAANFDGAGASYSAQALAAVGVFPWQSLSYNGVVFSWPNVPSGANNNYLANGQTIPLSGGPHKTVLALLGAADHSDASGAHGQVLVRYSDGSLQPLPLCLSDWTLGNGSFAPSCGNSIAIVTAYYNGPSGPQLQRAYVFYTELPLDPEKTVKSITLPTTVLGGRLHIFALGFK